MNRDTKEIATSARIRVRLHRAAILAQRSGIASYHTGAIIYDNRDKPVSTGWSHYSEYLKLRNYPRSIHAELHAILRTARRADLTEATIYVTNLRATNSNVTNAKPCLTCQSILAEVGIKTAFFTIDKNNFGKLVIA